MKRFTRNEGLNFITEPGNATAKKSQVPRDAKIRQIRTYLKIKIRVPGKTQGSEKAEHTRSM
jgi:hypothetical protein